jgi:ribosomal protein L37E
MTEKIILPEDPEAAELVTVQLWKPRGSDCLYDYEQDARYFGATHISCEKCGTITFKNNGKFCNACKKEKEIEIEKYNSLKFKEWDGKALVVIYNTEEYFYDKDEVLDYCHSKDIEPKDLQLMLCEPADKPSFDLDNIIDGYSEDTEPLADEDYKTLKAEVEILNESLHEKLINLWTQSDYRTAI